jgi:hypothetical protein
VGFVADKVALGKISLSVLRFSLGSNIPPTLHTHSFVCARRYVITALDCSAKITLRNKKKRMTGALLPVRNGLPKWCLDTGST